ncbi:MAG TPA: hypothetical protein VI566_03895 [Xanthomonadales bacterium]|nr:hypothetical protein [Xanthomonadales bacterium]
MIATLFGLTLDIGFADFSWRGSLTFQALNLYHAGVNGLPAPEKH